jgi:hypothetical protein
MRWINNTANILTLHFGVGMEFPGRKHILFALGGWGDIGKIVGTIGGDEGIIGDDFVQEDV